MLSLSSDFNMPEAARCHFLLCLLIDLHYLKEEELLATNYLGKGQPLQEKNKQTNSNKCMKNLISGKDLTEM